MDSVTSPISIGCDIGQVNDPTAIVVTEVRTVNRGLTRPVTLRQSLFTNRGPRFQHTPREQVVMEADFTVSYIERLPLGTSYVQVAERLIEVLQAGAVRGHPRFLTIDISGVGRPIYDMVVALIGAIPDLQDVPIRPVTFVYGNQYNRSTHTLGKGFLVNRLQVLLGRGGIHVQDTPEVRAMLEELKNYETRVSQNGMDTYGVFKVGKHDDLATALGLACLEDDYATADEAGVADFLKNYKGY